MKVIMDWIGEGSTMTETNDENGYSPVFRVLPDKTALCKADLDRLVDQIWDGAVHIGSREVVQTMVFREDGTIWAEAEEVKRRIERWMLDWRGYPRKTEVFCILIPLKGISSLSDARRFAEEFEDTAFGIDGEFGMRDNLYSLHPRAGCFEIQMLVNRQNGDDLLTFHKKKAHNFEGARDLLSRVAKEVGIKLASTDLSKSGFTMGFRDAIENGIDYRDFERVDRLPSGIEMVAIAGIWGDRQNLRCLFELADGRKVRREVYFQSGYELDEVGSNGMDLVSGGSLKLELYNS